MRQAVKYIAAVIGLGVLISVGVAVKGLLEANDYLDRCAAETSGRYIFGEEARDIACK